MATKASINQPLTFSDFKRFLANVLNIDEAKITPDSSFVEDLLVDSIRMVDLMLRMEEIGIKFPIEAAWDVKTVGEAYKVYQEHNYLNLSDTGATAETT